MPMRFVLAFLAVMALLVSPMTAAAAQGACSQGGPSATATTDMAAMPGMDQAGPQKAPADACCDHGASHKMDQKSCVQACATSCVVTAALPGPLTGPLLAFSTAQLNPARMASAHPYQPAGPRRPPKSMA
jgi:hypothetical protein